MIHRALVAASGKPGARGARNRPAAQRRRQDRLRGAPRHDRAGAVLARRRSPRFFDALQHARGPLAKDRAAAGAARAGSIALAGSYLVRILTGDLRIGLRKAWSKTPSPPLSTRRRKTCARRICCSATSAAPRCSPPSGALGRGGLDALSPDQVHARQPRADRAGHLDARPCSQAGRERRGRRSRAAPAFWVEDKFDGIRAQLHVGGWPGAKSSRAICARSPASLRDLARAARGLTPGAILDGEIVAYEAGPPADLFRSAKAPRAQKRGRPFSRPQRRAGRLQGVRSPLAAMARRCSASRSRSAARCSKRSRCRPAWSSSPIAPVHSAEEIESAFAAARAQRNEGLMAKDGASLYTPGRRGLAWLKFKKELATLDVVVVGAEKGHGKRSAVLSDYTFAVRDDETGALLTIGKAYSGVTDEEIEELTEHFIATTLACTATTAKCGPRSSSRSPSIPSSRASGTAAASRCASRASKPSAATRRRRRSTPSPTRARWWRRGSRLAPKQRLTINRTRLSDLGTHYAPSLSERYREYRNPAGPRLNDPGGRRSLPPFPICHRPFSLPTVTSGIPPR